MTADLSFTIERKEDVLCVPNVALRYFPPDVKLVREADKKLVTGKSDADEVDDQIEGEENDGQQERVRHVWVEGSIDEPGLRAIAVKTGVSDNRYTEVLSDELVAGQSLVVGKATQK